MPRLSVAIAALSCGVALAGCSSNAAAPSTVQLPTAVAVTPSGSTPNIGESPTATQSAGWKQVAEPFTVTETAVSGEPVYVTAKIGEPLLLSVKLDGDLSNGVGFRESPVPDLLVPVVPTGEAAAQQKENPTALPMIANKVGKTTVIVYALHGGEPDRSTAVGFEVTVTK